MALSVISAPGHFHTDGNGHLSAGPHPDGFADITDCCFVVQGVELRLHSQVITHIAISSCALLYR